MMIRFSPASEFPATGSHPAAALSPAVSPRDAAAGNNSSNYLGRGFAVGPREGRFSERSPAALPGAAQAATSRPFKAIGSRINSAFVSARAAFESGEVAQTLLDILAIFAGFFFGFVTGVSIVAAFVILFSGWL